MGATAWIDAVPSFADREARFVYVSSKAGDCFQMWIEPPVGGQVRVHAAPVDGQFLHEPTKDWQKPVTEIDAALEEAFATVIGWMIPSERYFPRPRSRLHRIVELIKGAPK